MKDARKELYDRVIRWEEGSRLDERDRYPFRAVLDEVLFHAEVRFRDYSQYSDTPFVVTLLHWINNMSRAEEQQCLVKLLSKIAFVDSQQTQALHRDAYRKVITPWLTRDMSATDLLAVDFERQVRTRFSRFRLFSITVSFRFPDFLSTNSLAGLPRPVVLGEERSKIKMRLPDFSQQSWKGMIILEDFVGTGRQAGRVLKEVRKIVPEDCELLFVPLLILQRGLRTLLEDPELEDVTVAPVSVIRDSECVTPRSQPAQPEMFSEFRALIKETADRVLRAFDELDDPPKNAFGYESCGSLVVTHHNTPNNTLPLIHHRSDRWRPLFRRIHHAKEELR